MLVAIAVLILPTSQARAQTGFDITADENYPSLTAVLVGTSFNWLLSAQGTWSVPPTTTDPSPPVQNKGFVQTSYPVHKVEVFIYVRNQITNQNAPHLMPGPFRDTGTWSIPRNTNVGALAVGDNAGVKVVVHYFTIVATTYDVPPMGPPQPPRIETTGPLNFTKSFGLIRTL